METAAPPPRPADAHELRTILTSVLARIQLARRHLRRGDHDATDAHLAEAERHVHRAAAAIDGRARGDD